MPLVTFEGPDGVGKTSGMRAVREWWEQTYPDLPAVWTAEPYSNEIRSVAFAPNTHPVTQASLMIADRVMHCMEVINPAIDRGEWVFCDRYMDSTVAYQAMGLLDSHKLWILIEQIHQEYKNGFRQGGVIPLPDITFLLVDDPYEAFHRSVLAGSDDPERDLNMESRGLDFQYRVATAYFQIAGRKESQYRKVDFRTIDPRLKNQESCQELLIDIVSRELGAMVERIKREEEAEEFCSCDDD